VAAGEVLRLDRASGGPPEFVGFPINLASRLQSYSRALGFLASARVGIPGDYLEDHGFVKVTAKRIKGFSSEILIADEHDLSNLSRNERRSLFEMI
jgi:class 3 adenylate cyclase